MHAFVKEMLSSGQREKVRGEASGKREEKKIPGRSHDICPQRSEGTIK